MIRYKRPTVQLTSLLDLLFLMIFVSLVQIKSMPETAEEPIAKAEQPKVEEPAPASTPAPTPAPVATPDPEPAPKQEPVRFPIQATFRFYPVPENPGLPEGSFLMEGTFNRKSKSLNLGGVSWIDRPGTDPSQDYEMVPLTGEIDLNERKFTGRVNYKGCREFTLMKAPDGSGSEGTFSALRGRWVGKYTCLQGATGLTLTIH